MEIQSSSTNEQAIENQPKWHQLRDAISAFFTGNLSVSLSRRFFLKTAVAVGASLLLKSAHSTTSEGENNLHFQTYLEKRMQNYRKIMTIEDPTERETVLKIWQIAQIGALGLRLTNRPVSGGLLEHYLFGNGQPLDISELYRQSLENHAENTIEGENSDAKLAHLLSTLIEFSVLNMPENKDSTIEKSTKLLSREGNLLNFPLIVNMSEIEDLRTAIGRNTAQFSESTRFDQLGDENEMDLKTIGLWQVNFYDTYDFLSNAAGGKKLQGQGRFSDLLPALKGTQFDIYLEIKDGDLELLVQHGLATKFKVSATVEGTTPISFSLPKDNYSSQKSKVKVVPIAP